MSVTAGPPPVGSEIGPACLRRQRVAAGMSQASLASKVHVSEATISRWESGVRRPPARCVEALAEALVVDERLVASWFAALPISRHDLVGRMPGLPTVFKQFGISPATLACCVGVDVSVVVGWVNHRKSLPRQVLPELAEVCGLDLAELLPILRASALARSSSTLKQARMRRGLSQSEVALRIGVSKSTVCHWEAGRWMPPLYRIRQLASVTRTPAGVLMSGMGWSRSNAIEPNGHGGLSEELRAARLESGLSIAQWARCVGVQPATLRRWEMGASEPRGRHRARVLQLLSRHGRAPSAERVG